MVTIKISQVRGGVAWSERGFARPIIGRRKGGTPSWRRVRRKDQLYSQLVRNDRLTPSTPSKGGTPSWRRVRRKDQLYSQLVRNDRLTPSTPSTSPLFQQSASRSSSTRKFASNRDDRAPTREASDQWRLPKLRACCGCRGRASRRRPRRRRRLSRR